MKRLLEEFRLMAVVGLLLVPICLLGWLFVSQSNKDIRFAEKELLGVQYLRSAIPVYAELTRPNPNLELAVFSELRAAGTALDEQLGTVLQSKKLASTLARSKPDFALATAFARDLIVAIGDQSNLILDPDLDTYYLMDALVMRTPDIIALTGELSNEAKVPAALAPRPAVTAASAKLLSALDALEQSLNRSFINIQDPILAHQLPMDSGIFSVSTRIATQRLSTETSVVEITELQSAIIGSAVQLWSTKATQLETLLQNRIDRFREWLVYALTLSALTTLAAIILAVKVLRRLLHRLDDKIVYMAHHDDMTRVKNRGSFTTEMAEALKDADNTGEKLALHMIDLDRFKSINDSMGHLAGDAILKTLAERLITHSRNCDLVGRLGGDEFVVLQRQVTDTENVESFANRLVLAMRQPVQFEDTLVRSSISVGTALFPLHGTESQKLLGSADLALYAAKAAGRDRALIFTNHLDADVRRRRSIESELRDAVLNNRFTLNFQPQFDAKGIHLRGFEALLRLRTKAGENISPADFIPIAEHLGLIEQIGEWVLHNACAVACNWPKEIYLAVNLSPLQFARGNVSHVIADALKKSGLAPERLQVEITEGLLMADTQAVIEQLNALRALGVSIAMDDFGTGYSSLSYLWRFPFDKIKIDRSFLRALETDQPGAENVLRTIVMLGHSLEMIVTAEGVETNQQAELMTRIKCDEIQGFLYGRPIPEDELASVILKAFQRAKAEKDMQPNGAVELRA
jgi:diguanylate cyclase (GGDEF)-like protein